MGLFGDDAKVLLMANPVLAKPRSIPISYYDPVSIVSVPIVFVPDGFLV